MSHSSSSSEDTTSEESIDQWDVDNKFINLSCACPAMERLLDDGLRPSQEVINKWAEDGFCEIIQLLEKYELYPDGFAAEYYEEKWG